MKKKRIATENYYRKNPFWIIFCVALLSSLQVNWIDSEL